MKNTGIELALDFEGMTTEAGLALMDIFLKNSFVSKPDGLCFEFGTYKGRTAALIANRLTDVNWLHVIDNSNHPEIDKLLSISSRVTWHKKKSEVFCREELLDVVEDRQVSYSHHDASHFFNNVHTELSLLVPHMATEGIMVLDDFTDSFSQVRAAYYHLRYTESFPFELLAIGYNKAILVHQSMFDYYENYIIHSFLADMRAYDLDCQLCRSDINKFSRGFFVKNKPSASAPDFHSFILPGLDAFYGSSNEYLSSRELGVWDKFVSCPKKYF